MNMEIFIYYVDEKIYSIFQIKVRSIFNKYLQQFLIIYGEIYEFIH